MACGRDRPLPQFVEREFHRFLECGILAHGFLRVHCDACGRDRLVAFSCKGRGFCPTSSATTIAHQGGIAPGARATYARFLAPERCAGAAVFNAQKREEARSIPEPVN